MPVVVLPGRSPWEVTCPSASGGVVGMGAPGLPLLWTVWASLPGLAVLPPDSPIPPCFPRAHYHQGLAWPRVSGLPVLVLPEAPGQVIGLVDRAAGPRTGSPIVLTALGLTTRVRNSVAPSL